jgi:succinate dehydrogenase flavin-adding protein (antitoxin of CptAB toxin-antitoxin module)
MFAEFQHEYAELSDDELLQVASDRQSLTDEAKSALDAEMRNRDLTSADLAAHQHFVKRSEQRETRRRNRTLFGSRRGLLEWVRFGFWTLLAFLATALVVIWLSTR